MWIVTKDITNKEQNVTNDTMQLIELKMFFIQRKTHLRNDAICSKNLNSIDISTVEMETKYSSYMVINRKLRKRPLK